MNSNLMALVVAIASPVKLRWLALLPTPMQMLITYFAQVGVLDKIVDFSPNCGNMLAGVAPYAIETGLFPASQGTTTVRIHNLNTGKIIHSTVQTPQGKVEYTGNTIISGTNSPGAPIQLTFLNVEGAKTGKLLPTGNVVDIINSTEVTCIDAATPVVLIKASDLGKTGNETPSELDNDTEIYEPLRVHPFKSGRTHGIGRRCKLGYS